MAHASDVCEQRTVKKTRALNVRVSTIALRIALPDAGCLCSSHCHTAHTGAASILNSKMASLPTPPCNNENTPPPPHPPLEEVEEVADAAPLVLAHTSGETDILDQQLECLEGSLRSAAALDPGALSLATALAEKGDTASIMRAHAVLTECGVAMGLWDLNQCPKKAAGDAVPVGAMYSDTAQIPRPRYYNASQLHAKEQPRRVSLDLANASATSLANAPSLVGE